MSTKGRDTLVGEKIHQLLRELGLPHQLRVGRERLDRDGQAALVTTRPPTAIPKFELNTDISDLFP